MIDDRFMLSVSSIPDLYMLQVERNPVTLLATKEQA